MIFLILLFTQIANAENCFPIGKPDARTTYAKCSVCEKTEGHKCYDITNCPPEICSIQDRQVDDHEKPLYEAKSNVQACDGEESCQALLVEGACPETHFAVIKDDFTEVYCTRVVGYEQKTITGLFQDQVKLKAKADKDAAEKAIADALDAKIKAAKALKGKNNLSKEEIELILNALLERL